VIVVGGEQFEQPATVESNEAEPDQSTVADPVEVDEPKAKPKRKRRQSRRRGRQQGAGAYPRAGGYVSIPGKGWVLEDG
jgi:hypothetical protein